MKKQLLTPTTYMQVIAANLYLPTKVIFSKIDAR